MLHVLGNERERGVGGDRDVGPILCVVWRRRGGDLGPFLHDVGLFLHGVLLMMFVARTSARGRHSDKRRDNAIDDCTDAADWDE